MRLGDLDGGRPGQPAPARTRRGRAGPAARRRRGGHLRGRRSVPDLGHRTHLERTHGDPALVRRRPDRSPAGRHPGVAPSPRDQRADRSGDAHPRRRGAARPTRRCRRRAASRWRRMPANHRSPMPGPTRCWAGMWRCPEPDCPSYGAQRTMGQPPPSMRGGVPTCPRHGTRLSDAGVEAVGVADVGPDRRTGAAALGGEHRAPGDRRPGAGRQDRRDPRSLPGRGRRPMDQPQSHEAGIAR